VALYLDSAYMAKCYLQEPDSRSVRALVEGETELFSTAWAVVEMACIFHRHLREGRLKKHEALALQERFEAHVEEGLWVLAPLSEGLLRRAAEALKKLEARVLLRAGDTIHLVTAQAAGFHEVWSSDRNLLRAAPHFGVRGRSV